MKVQPPSKLLRKKLTYIPSGSEDHIEILNTSTLPSYIELSNEKVFLLQYK